LNTGAADLSSVTFNETVFQSHCAWRLLADGRCASDKSGPSYACCRHASTGLNVGQ